MTAFCFITVLGVFLETKSRPELELSSRRRRRKTERRGRRDFTIAARFDCSQFGALSERQTADDIINALEIRPVCQIETFGNQFDITAIRNIKSSAETHIERIKTFAFAGVSSD